MSTLTVVVWENRNGYTDDIFSALNSRGIFSAKIVPAWGQGTRWAFSVRLAELSIDPDTTQRDLDIQVGWLLGLLGVGRDTQIDYDVKAD
jgi:hypothetical protein